MTTTFTISEGDLIRTDDANGRGIQEYRVQHVSANGAVRAENTLTGKLRDFGGYGWIIPAEPAAVTTTYECMNCGTIRTPGPGWIGCEDRLGASCRRRPAPTITTTTAQRIKAGDTLIRTLGYPEVTLCGAILDVRRSPTDSVVTLGFRAGELLLWPTDVVEVVHA